jgi:hypothetical protein
MNRRELISRFLGTAAVAAGFPRESSAAQPDDSWQPQFLTSAQSDTLAAIGERLIPGSAAAHCNRVLDLMMTIESTDVREQLVQSIAAFDKAARSAYGEPFSKLPPDRQDSVVAAQAVQTSATSSFAVIKEWMADTYWSSKEGLRELGWNGQVAWSDYPACHK